MATIFVLIFHAWISLVLADKSTMVIYCNHTLTRYGETCMCKNFQTYSQLDLSFCLGKDNQILHLEPSRENIHILDTDIIPILQLNVTSYINQIYLVNLAGIDLNLLRDFDSLFVPLASLLAEKSITLIHLIFNLYLDGQPVQLSYDKNAPKGKRCNESLFVSMFNKRTNIFNLNPSSLGLIDPHFSSSNLCPFIFQHSNIRNILIKGPPFQFDPTNYSNLNDLNSTIKNYIIYYAYKLNLDDSTLHAYVFGPSLTKLQFHQCSLNMIQTNVFKDFKKLKLLLLDLNNPRFFFHKNGVDWTNYLNSGLNLTDMSQATKQTYFEILIHVNLNNDYLYQQKFFPYYEYTFPGEDFCLFQNFAHNKLVIPLISPSRPINCSCTLYSLVKNYPYYYSVPNMSPDWNNPIWLCFENYTDWIGDKNCNISCNISQSNYQAHYFDLYDLKNQFLLFKKWSFSIFGPVAGVFGCITNIMVIFTIKSAARIAKKRSKTPETGDKHALVDPKQPFFVYMLINAVVNLLDCAMYFFYYIIKCEDQIVGDRGFVSSSCFIKTLSINITASVLKLLSNFTFLQMSVNRYALVGKDHYKFLLRVANMRIRKYIGWGILVSLALSVVIYFQQDFFSSSLGGQVFSEAYYYNDYFWYGYASDGVRKYAVYKFTIQKLEKLPYLSGFTMVHDLFSYFLFCIVTTVIDAMTVVRLRKVLSEKKQLLANVSSKSTKKQKAQSDEIEKSEKKSIAMIVLNSLAIFILRSPELISVIFFYDLLLNQNSDYTFKMFCYSYRQCLAVLDLSNIFYLFSLSLNFIFYYLFNLSFKITFNEAIDLLKKFLTRSEV